MLTITFLELLVILLVLSFIALGVLFVFLAAAHLLQPCNFESEPPRKSLGTTPKVPVRVLDELAEAFHVISGRPTERHVATSLNLDEQFSHTICPELWHRLEKSLGCRLPALRSNPEGWAFPD